MKHLAFTLSFTLAVTLAAFPVNAQTTSAPPKAVQPPQVVIKGFYEWYIRSIARNIDPFKKGRATLRTYVTLRLIREVEKTELEADYFLQSQDWDDAWEKTISISSPKVRGTTATAIVTFNAEEYPRVLVSLRQESGIWKIDRVSEARS
jgi:hypothetical protein